MTTENSSQLPQTSFDRAAQSQPVDEQAVHSHLHPTPSWDLADHPQPTGREEGWRFTPIERIQPILDADGQATGQVISVDQVDGVTLTELSAEDAQARSIEPPVDRVAALAASRCPQPLLLKIEPNTVLDAPLNISVDGAGTNESAFSHLIIDIGECAEVQMILEYTGAARLASKIDVHVGDNAQVNFVYLQDWEADSLHGAQVSFLIGRDAKIQTVQASLGGGVTRIVERASYAGPGGEIDQLGVYFVDGARHVEHRMFVDHNHPSTVSNVDYRGALQNQGAHAVWVGDVLIRPQAVGINTYESNKNLLLTEGCQADAVPNLEIETGDIEGAGHSASTGRFDDMQLFYLQSRGIPEDEAKRLVVKGFFYDIIAKIGVSEVEDKLTAIIDHELTTSSASASADKAAVAS